MSERMIILKLTCLCKRNATPNSCQYESKTNITNISLKICSWPRRNAKT